MFKVNPSEPLYPKKSKFQIDLDWYCIENGLHYEQMISRHSNKIHLMFYKNSHSLPLVFGEIDFLNVRHLSYPPELLEYIKEQTKELLTPRE